jgi:ribosomal protein S3
LRDIQKSIVGLKVICSGKWKKTRSGRKQKFLVKFGRIKNPSISVATSYNYAFQKTKFGSCSIKVWISHTKKR